MLKARPKHTQVSGAFVKIDALFGLVYTCTRLSDITVCSVDKRYTSYRLYNLLIDYSLPVLLRKCLVLGWKRRAGLLTIVRACVRHVSRYLSVEAMAHYPHETLLYRCTSSAPMATGLYAVKTMAPAVDTRAYAGTTMHDADFTMYGAGVTRHAAGLTKHCYTEIVTGYTASMSGYGAAEGKCRGTWDVKSGKFKVEEMTEDGSPGSIV